MIFYDFEVFRYDWILCFLDTDTRKVYSIVNDKEKLERFYNYYKNTIMVGYNSRNYDQWIFKAILCGFNPYEMSDWIINKDRKGHEFSRLLWNFPILNYDTSYFFKSLKELSAYMGHDIKETPVDFNIDRPLTESEIKDTVTYCKHDVTETFEVFVEMKDEYESIICLLKEFDLPINMISKTKAQLSAEILGAETTKHNDEFDIKMPDCLQLGKYQWILDDHFYPWAKNSQNYEEISLEKVMIMGVPHNFGVGGIHGALVRYIGNGLYIMFDVDSYYPAAMILFGFLSRNVRNPSKYRMIRDTRLVMKRNKDPRQAAYKIVLNGTFGASKDRYNKLYDPRQANNLCIANQLFIVDLLEKLEGKCELIQSNTDGILVKLFKEEDRDMICGIVHDWETRTGFTMGRDNIKTVIQRDVNNYIIIKDNDAVKRKGGVVKKLSRLDNDLPIVNRAVVDFFVNGIDPEVTIMASTALIDFQKITKVGGKYEHAWHNGKILNERVNRCFASLDTNDTTLMKKHKSKETLDKVASTPIYCFIDNENIEDKKLPAKLDKQWYLDLARERIKDFV